MYSHSFRNQVATGAYSLPFMATLSFLLWILPGGGDWRLWAGLITTALTTFLIMELNNRYSLLRIRSRMMSVSYLAMMLVCPNLHVWDLEALVPAGLLLSYFMLFASYQKLRPEGYVFHAFLFNALVSLVYPPLILGMLPMCVCMIFQLRNFTWRTFMAGIFGAMIPYWFYVAYMVWNNQLDMAFAGLPALFIPVIPDCREWLKAEMITPAVLILIAFIAFVHFFRTSYNDKIKTRMLFYTIATQEVFIVLLMVFFPTGFEGEMRLFIANSSLLVGHYYALARGRLANVWFNLTVVLLGGLCLYNYLIF